MATVVIGDIHGNFLALHDLLAKLIPELKPEDTLVFLGDYIDRGLDSQACVERIIRLKEGVAFQVITLLGNHEDWMLKTLRDYTKHSWVLGMEAFETISSYSVQAAAELRLELENAGIKLVTKKVHIPYELFFSRVPVSHLAFFESLLPFYRTPDIVCVHGGVRINGKAVEEQNVQDLIWGAEGFPEQCKGHNKIVYGHWNNMEYDKSGWPLPRIQGELTFGIDTISTGVLTAMRFPDHKIIQSDSFPS